MASTERGLALAPLGAEDATCAVDLSASAGWNQTGADWRLLLTLGEGWALHDEPVAGTGRLAASTVVVPYGRATTDPFAWISMVLVRPDRRREGLATALLARALARLTALRCVPVLDATPAGRDVYLRAGFEDRWTFTRLQRAAAPTAVASPPNRSRALRDEDWPALVALDREVFGADRSVLLRSLAARAPAAARVVEDGAGRLKGFILARDGRLAWQLGPLVVADDDTACALLDAALATLSGPVFLDLNDARPAMRRHLTARGFGVQRPFTRMVRGSRAAPGADERTAVVVGPEFG